jgi:hypothetical protein
VMWQLSDFGFFVKNQMLQTDSTKAQKFKVSSLDLKGRLGGQKLGSRSKQIEFVAKLVEKKKKATVFYIGDLRS